VLQLAMGVLGGLFGGVYAMVGGSSKSKPATPPINASSPDEADFIKCAHTRTSNPDAIVFLTYAQELHGAGRGGREEGEPEALGWA
jgi:F-type H+-transporting ATPase subunit k